MKKNLKYQNRKTMKEFFCFTIFVFSLLSQLCAQNRTFPDFSKWPEPLKSEQILLNQEKPFIVEIDKIDDKSLKDLLKNSTINGAYQKKSITKNKLSDYNTDKSFIDTTGNKVVIHFSTIFREIDDSDKIEVKLKRNAKDTGITYTIALSKSKSAKNPDSKKSNLNVLPNKFITDGMIKSVSDGICNSCDKAARISDKSFREYNTDYFITYDPSKGTSGDVYTICKHIFRNFSKLPDYMQEKYKNVGPGNNKSKYLEMYKKKKPMYFAPSVGSSITFEAVNIPLNNITNLVVDEKDLFNNGSTQFASIISGLVTAQIVNPLTPKSNQTESPDSNQQSLSTDSIKEQLLTDLTALNSELQSYISAFRISSCAINAHQSNLRKILTAINSNIGVDAAGTEDIEQKLTSKIDKIVSDEAEKTTAKKNATAIATALKALNGLKPLVYSTIRAKNRDYIEVKYRDANGQESKPENIRMSGGMKIDFSAGFILTGLKDYSYVLKPQIVQYDPDDSTYLGASNGPLPMRDTLGNVITKENSGRADVGVSILTHFYPRLSSHYNLGGAVGLMTTTDLNLRLMLGGSFIVSSLFGSNNRISFTSGVVWGKVKRLGVQDEPYLDKPYVINGKPNFYTGTPVLADKTDHSWFFSVNFNFGGQ
jgi:hypothetical protein